MACNDIITIIPSGCLEDTEITLSCKSQGEVKPYWISVANRMLSTDYITNVTPQPALESKVIVDKIEIEGQTFKCKIKGGKNNHNVGIRFVIFTNEENIIEFDCKLPIRQSGVLEKNGAFPMILDATSPAGTIKVNSTMTLPSGSDATVEDVGQEGASLLNFYIPRGEKGDTGATGAQGPQGDAVLSDADQGNFDTIVDAFALNTTTQVSPVDTALSQNSTSAYSYYTMQAQSAWQGRLVTQIGFKVATAGIITVSLLENPNSSDFSIIKQVKITVDKDTIWYDLNWSVGDKQYIAVCEKGDTGLFKYANYQGDAGKGYYVYVPGASPYWALNQINLNIGIKIKNIQTLIDVSTINAYLTDKNVSFLGDSVTTFKGYVPSGYAVYYPTGDVQSVSKTWWKQFLNKTGGTLLTNNSYSGSYVSSNGPGSLQTRLTGIDAKTDVCLIFMGTNDFGNGVTLGEFDPTKTTFDTSQFTDAVCNTIVQLTTTYPTTKFVWLTPTKRFASGVYAVINGQTQDVFTNRIIEVCKYYGVEYLDMRGVGLTLYNKGKYTGDGSLHPNALGHTLFFNYIYRNLFKILG